MDTVPVAERSAPRLPAVRPDTRTPGATLFALACLILIGTVLRFWRIGHQSFWYDEAATQALVRHSFGRMLSLVRQTEGTPPLYFSLAWVWARIFGFWEAGLRSLSAVAGVAVIPVTYALGARLMSRRAGLIAAALVACNPLLIWYSQEARSYSLLVLTSALSMLTFVHLLGPRPSGRWFAAWALTAALALATHYFAVLIVVPEALWLVWVHRREPLMWVAICAVGVVSVLLVSFAVKQTANDAAWITSTPLGQRLGQIPPQFLLGTGAPARTLLKIAGAVALGVAAVMLVIRAGPRERWGAVRAGLLALAGFVLSLLLIVIGFDRIISRNEIVVLVAVILLVAGGLGARRAGVLGLAGAAVLCAVGIVAVVGVAENTSLQRPAWRALGARLVADRPAGAAGAIIYENSDSTVPIDDYVPGLRWLSFGARVQEVDVVAADRLRSFCSGACSLSPAQLDTSISFPGFHAAGPVVHVDQWSIYRLRADTRPFLTRPEVAAALNHAPTITSFGLFVQPPT